MSAVRGDLLILDDVLGVMMAVERGQRCLREVMLSVGCVFIEMFYVAVIILTIITMQ